MVTTVQPIKVGSLKVPASLKGPVNIGLSGDWKAWEIFGVLDHNRGQAPVQTTIINAIGSNSYGGSPTVQSIAAKINDSIKERQDTGYARVNGSNEITLRGRTIRFSLEYDPRQVPWDSTPSCEHIMEGSELIFRPLFPHALSGKSMSSTLDLHITSHYGVETALTSFPPDEPSDIDTFYIPRVMSSSALNQATKVSTGSFTIASIAPFIQTLDKMFSLVELNLVVSNTIGSAYELAMENKALTKILQRITTSVPNFNLSHRIRPQVGYKTDMSFKTSQPFDPLAFETEITKLSQPGQPFEDFYIIDQPPQHYNYFPYTFAAYVLPGSIAGSSKVLNKGYISTQQNPKGYALIVAQAMLDLIDANQQQALKAHTKKRRIFP